MVVVTLWEQVFPSETEEAKIKEIINSEIHEVREWLSRLEAEADVIPVGSTVKGTFLRGTSDIDVFVVSPQYEKLFTHVKYWKPEGKVKRGELLIWNYRKNGFEVDLVFIPPDYPKIDTLNHTSFYKENLSESMKNEVRKAKAFFISVGTYKAETGGITGVAIEELIRKHETLEGLCRFVVNNQLEDVWVQDPTTTRSRNLLASINPVRWRQMQEACGGMLNGRSVSLRSFTPSDFMTRHKGEGLVRCDREHDRATDFSTALSLCTKSGNELRSLEADAKFGCDAYVNDEILIAVKATPTVLPPSKEVCIPEELEDAVQAFKKAHPEVETYEKQGFVCALVERKVSHPDTFMKEALINRMQDSGYVCKVVI